MFKRPMLTIVALLHVIGIFVLACIDNRQLGTQLSDFLGLGLDDPISRFGTRMLGRKFSAWNFVSALPSYLLFAMIFSQVGIFGVWFSYGCDTALKKVKVLIIASLWILTMWELPPMLLGESVSVSETLQAVPYYAFAVLGTFGIAWLFHTTARDGSGPTGTSTTFSLKQAFGLLTLVAIGLAMKGANYMVAFAVLSSLATGISTCFAIWSWSPRSLYRLALSAVTATGLGFVSLVAVGDRVGNEGIAWLCLPFATAAAIQTSFAILGPIGRKEIGLT